MKEQQVKQFYTKLNKAIDKYQNLCIKQRTFSLAGCAEEFRKRMSWDCNNEIPLHECFPTDVSVQYLVQVVGWIVQHRRGDIDATIRNYRPERCLCNR